MYIAIEGIDGSGKSEQVALVAKKLRALGKIVHTVSEPNKEFIKSLNTEDQRVIATAMYIERLAKRNEYQQILDCGEFIVSDRCFASTFAYQGQHCWQFVRGLHHAMIDSIVLPDMIFILHLDPKIAIERVIKRDGECTKHERQMMIGAADLYRSGDCTFYVKTVLMDAAREPETVASTIIDFAKIHMRQNGLGGFA